MIVIRENRLLRLSVVCFYSENPLEQDSPELAEEGDLFGNSCLGDPEKVATVGLVSIIKTFVDACDGTGRFIVSPEHRAMVRQYLREVEGDEDRSEMERDTDDVLWFGWFGYRNPAGTLYDQLTFKEYVGLGRPEELGCKWVLTKSK